MVDTISEQELIERLIKDIARIMQTKQLPSGKDDDVIDATFNPYTQQYGYMPFGISPQVIKENREGHHFELNCDHMHKRPSTEYEIDNFCFDDRKWRQFFMNRQERNMAMYKKGLYVVRLTRGSLLMNMRDYETWYFDKHGVDITFMNGVYRCMHGIKCLRTDCKYEK